MSSGTYIHGSDPEEQRRLATLNALINRSSISAMRLAGGERVLDVGSGLGQLTRAIARAAGAEGLVVAVERDPAQIHESKRVPGGPEDTRIDFRLGDATDLPLREDEWGTFDLAHTRFVLEHVRDPRAVVTSMVRALRPGGRIILEDDDHAALRLWPEVPALEFLWSRYEQSYRLIGNDPWVGRKLVSLIHDAGALPVKNDSLFFGACKGDPRFDPLFTNLLGIIQTARTTMLEARLVTTEEYEAGIHEGVRWARSPDAALWYQTCWAEGVKPGGEEPAARTARGEATTGDPRISPLALLVESARDLNSSLELSEVFRKIANRIRDFVEHHLLCVMLWNERTRLLEHSYSVRFGEHLEQRGGFPLGYGISGSAAKDRRAIRVSDVRNDPRYVRVRHAEVEILSELAIPLLVQDRLIGVIDIESTELGSFTEEHESLLTALASQIATALENARLYEELRSKERRMEEDLALARELQCGLLPASPPAIGGIRIGAICAAAKELSGDFYEMFEAGGSQIAIAVGDVAGKSTPAALYGALAVGGLREYASKYALDPSEMLHRLDAQLRRFRDQGRFLAMTYGVFDAADRTLAVASAGFPPTLLIRAGRVIEIESHGPPLGTLLGHDLYKTTRVQLEQRDLVVLVSDGFEDCVDGEGRTFGRDGLMRVLERAPGDPQDVAQALLDATDQWAGGAEIADDRTVVVVRIDS